VAGDVNGVEIVVFPTIIWTASSIWARCPRSRSCAELDVAARGGLRHAGFARGNELVPKNRWRCDIWRGRRQVECFVGGSRATVLAA
jgi:hypothetical protein